MNLQVFCRNHGWILLLLIPLSCLHADPLPRDSALEANSWQNSNDQHWLPSQRLRRMVVVEPAEGSLALIIPSKYALDGVWRIRRKLEAQWEVMSTAEQKSVGSCESLVALLKQLEDALEAMPDHRPDLLLRYQKSKQESETKFQCWRIELSNDQKSTDEFRWKLNSLWQECEVSSELADWGRGELKAMMVRSP